MISRINNIVTQPIICLIHSAIKCVRNASEKLLTIACFLDDCDETVGVKNLQFIQHVIKEKNNDINAEELNQIKKIKCALNYNSRLQKELKELSDEELRLYFCHTYVESSHALEPLIAYNKKDCLTKMDNSESDDNINMLSAYAYMIAFTNEIFSKDLTEDLPKKIERVILTLYSILLTGSEKNINEIEAFQRTKFCVYMSELDNGESISNEMDELRISRKIIDLGYSNNISFQIRENDKGIWFVANNYSDLIGSSKFNDKSLSYEDQLKLIKKSETIRSQQCLHEISSNLANAISIRNEKAIFKITSDLMYLHLFPNANGRASQIIRDSLNIAWGLYPYKALTHMSQYMYVASQPDEEHMLFMQKHSEVILKSIKDGHAADLENRKLTDHFIESYKNTKSKQIVRDIKNYIQSISNYSEVRLE